MAAAPLPDPATWMATFQRATDRVAEGLRRCSGPQRLVETGTRGEGGDRTLVIDADAEGAIFDELDGLHAAGARFTALSEERGTVDYGSPDALVVIDPIDGSTNAKRGLPQHAVSLALAVGEDVARRGTMADVVCGLVAEVGSLRGERWTAVRDGGAQLDGTPVVAPESERITSRGLLELVAIESADPRHVLAAGPALTAHVHRLRAIGATALALCQVAGGRVDGMASLRRCRAVDVAAGQLIVRESGGLVAFGSLDDPLAAPLDLAPHVPVVAARSAAGLARVAELPPAA
ncbi:inositol monophosphatase family protein [Patulibacter defluvii]|uniref:inositol monophosphatase family protein n=1 Tax=Patulibacter defluvii TaxID=3095358 RepID=UPI002A75505D|nr:inositol monophosphatase family protein [Patulibacter sp. DM4]